MIEFNENIDGVNIQNAGSWSFLTTNGDYGFSMTTDEGVIYVARKRQSEEVPHDHGQYVLSDKELARLCAFPTARESQIGAVKTLAPEFKRLCNQILRDNSVKWVRKNGVTVGVKSVYKTYVKSKWC